MFRGTTRITHKESLLNSDKFSACYGASGFPYLRRAFTKPTPEAVSSHSAPSHSIRRLSEASVERVIIHHRLSKTMKLDGYYHNTKFVSILSRSEHSVLLLFFVSEHHQTVSLQAVRNVLRHDTADTLHLLFPFDKPDKFSIILL